MTEMSRRENDLPGVFLISDLSLPGRVELSPTVFVFVEVVIAVVAMEVCGQRFRLTASTEPQRSD